MSIIYGQRRMVNLFSSENKFVLVEFWRLFPQQIVFNNLSSGLWMLTITSDLRSSLGFAGVSLLPSQDAVY